MYISFLHDLDVSNKSSENLRIIDSEATYHIINTSKHFHIYVSYLSNRKIDTANSSLNMITGKDDIKLSPILVLENMLHVFKLYTNLASATKLPQDLNCKATFLSSHHGC